MTIVEHNSNKLKFVYEAYNANEKYNVYLFDGKQWNLISTILDIGVEPNKYAYNIWLEARRKQRANELYKKAVKYLKTFL